jgi:hypothetical protein
VSSSLSQAAQKPDLFYKQDFNNPVFQSDDPALMKIWNHFCQRARIYSRAIRWNNKFIPLERGQLIFGRIKASQNLNLTEWKIRDRVKKLVDLGLISKVSEKQGKRGYSVYQVVSMIEQSPSITSQPPQSLKRLTSRSPKEGSATKKERLDRKRKTYNAKRKSPSLTQLTEQDVCLSHPLIVKNDRHGLLKRYGADFLTFILEKARQHTKDSTNPIGLLIYMLRTGAYAGQYADLKRTRQKSQEQMIAIELLEQRATEERQRQERTLNLALERTRELIQVDRSFRNQMRKRISSNLRQMRPFLQKILPDNFTVEDVLENPRALSYYSADFFKLLQSRCLISA